MKKAAFILILFITVSFTVNTTVSINIDLNKSIPSDNQVKTSAKMTCENSEIKESFQKISDLKYDEKKCNCKHKSEAFARTLVKNGINNVYLVTIEHHSGQYSHMVVLWNDKVYDATPTPSIYGMPENEYFNKIEKYGFNGLRVKVPYTG